MDMNLFSGYINTTVATTVLPYERDSVQLVVTGTMCAVCTVLLVAVSVAIYLQIHILKRQKLNISSRSVSNREDVKKNDKTNGYTCDSVRLII